MIFDPAFIEVLLENLYLGLVTIQQRILEDWRKVGSMGSSSVVISTLTSLSYLEPYTSLPWASGSSLIKWDHHTSQGCFKN